MASWTPRFMGTGYNERARILHSYLRLRKELGLTDLETAHLKQVARCTEKTDNPLSYAYLDILKFIVASISVRSEYRYVSKKADERLGGEEPDYDKMYDGKDDRYKNLTNEHAIPVSVIVDYLLSLPEKELTAEYLEDFIEKVSGLAAITNDEDGELINKGRRSNLCDAHDKKFKNLHGVDKAKARADDNRKILKDIIDGNVEQHRIRYKAANIDMKKKKHDAKE